jgi:hypothetical protein
MKTLNRREEIELGKQFDTDRDAICVQMEEVTNWDKRYTHNQLDTLRREVGLWAGVHTLPIKQKDVDSYTGISGFIYGVQTLAEDPSNEVDEAGYYQDVINLCQELLRERGFVRPRGRPPGAKNKKPAQGRRSNQSAEPKINGILTALKNGRK